MKSIDISDLQTGGCADPGTVGGGVRTDLGRRRRRADYFCMATAACQILRPRRRSAADAL